MSGEHPPEPGVGTPRPARSASAARFQTGMRGLLVAVACFGIVTWAGRSLWESQHPAIGAARGLASPEPADRVGAAVQLRSLGLVDPVRAVPPLVAALGDREAEVRIAAVESLGVICGVVIGTGSAGDPIRAAARGLIGASKDPEPNVRKAAMNALASLNRQQGTAGVVDPREVIGVLAAALGDPDEEVRLAALHSLSSYGPHVSSDPPAALAATLEDPSPRNRAAAITTLAAFPSSLDRWLPSLLRNAEHESLEVRLACYMAVTRYRSPPFSADAIPSLVAALRSRSRIVRSYAAQGLFSHDSDPRAAMAIPALLLLLREPIDPELAQPPGPGQPIVWNGWDPPVQAAYLLGQLAPGTGSAGEALAALTEVARSGHPSRRPSAILALRGFGPAADPAVPLLIRALRDDLATKDEYQDHAGDAAARALGRIAPGTRSAEAALGALIEALDARPRANLAMRSSAMEVLPSFGPEAARALPQLRAWRDRPDHPLTAVADRAFRAIEGAGPGKRDGDPGR